MAKKQVQPIKYLAGARVGHLQVLSFSHAIDEGVFWNCGKVVVRRAAIHRRDSV